MVMVTTRMKSPLAVFHKNCLLSLRTIVLLFAVQIIVERFEFVASLSAPRIPESTSANCGTSTGRRDLLSGLLTSFASFGILAASTLVDPAHAAIDVSGLKVENPIATDIFLGGTYYPDDDVDREGVDGRISRMKYRIELASPPPSSSSSSLEFSGLYRSVKVKGVSSAISSSRDDYLELPATIFQCSGSDEGARPGGQCISIDFSPMGGPSNVQGYWDDNDKGIRFVRDNKVWSKQ
eukprot:CAMPEP_0172387934 /NCGR_PEP_ID=MMETSP1061-20121228/5124_1 /TAXON_ID=37318 /ORGANISM="Pseudo-nitzschia pungens, Strain cf. pungens" /LENGTH=236 /DNA_ID=CAMNT_0013117687 /DNA_START=204 /DNA_END=914 /DNA_ORIENTATION=+